MLSHRHRRVLDRAFCAAFVMASLPGVRALAQDATNTPTSVPANVSTQSQTAPRPKISEKQAREADDAYIEGAKFVERQDLAAAEHSFQRAVALNPTNVDYAMALAHVREQRVTQLVQESTKVRLAGDNTRADQMLQEARQIDPENPLVLQHLTKPWQQPTDDPLVMPPADIASTLGGAVELKHSNEKKNLHLRNASNDLIRAVYNAYGVNNVVFDPSLGNSGYIKFDLEDVDFDTATRLVFKLTHAFGVALQPDTVLVAKDTQENRDKFMPLLEETLYLPGVPNDQMTELANVARNIFDLKSVTASATNGDILLRGDAQTLRLVNDTLSDLVDGGSEVVFDIRLYELDKQHETNFGASIPSGAGIFSVAAEAQSVLAANQSTIAEAINAGLLTLKGTPLQQELEALEFLIGTGTVSVTQYANLLGTFGNGLSFAGLYLASNSTFNLLMTSSDARTLDQVTLRGTNGQPLNFRAGERYPVITGTYSSGYSSSALSGLSASQQALAAQYLGTGSSVSIPQFQFEDLGMTIKVTPHVQKDKSVQMTLDMKIEALGGTSLNNVPILESRAMTSNFTVPFGQTAMLLSHVTDSEMKSIAGLPGLGSLPGFTGVSDKDVVKTTDELLITITPHLSRPGSLHFASHPVLTGSARPTAQ